jgi:selenocysteine lyase/cysteine desulfurase
MLVTSHVQYSTGFRQDLKKLGKITKQKGIYLVVNPTQSLGALYFSVNDFGIDFMASNGHKWPLSSFGVGTMYIRRKYLKDLEKFKPFFFSQSGQKERESFHANMNLNISTTATRFELGTPHIQNIVALNAALRYITKIGIRNIEKELCI